MATQPQSMILDMLKTPQQVRQEQLAKLRQQSAAQAQLLAQPVRGTTALPGLLSRFAAGEAMEQRVDLDKAARRAAGAVGSALEMAGYDEAAQTARQALASPEERLAQNRQNILKGVDTSSSKELMLAAKRLQEQGDTAGASRLIAQAQQIEKQSAETALTREKALTEVTVRLKNMAAAGIDEARRMEVLQKLPFELTELEKNIILKESQIEKTTAETERILALMPGEVTQQQADLALTLAREGKTEQEIITEMETRGVKIDEIKARTLASIASAEVSRATVLEKTTLLDGRVKQQAAELANTLASTDQTRQEIAESIAKLPGELQNLDADVRLKYANILATDALKRKRDVEIGAIEAKLPGELALQQANLIESGAKTDEIRSRIDLNNEKLRTMNHTDFMKELEASNISDKQKEKLINERVKVRARTGDIQNIGTKVVDMKLESISKIIAEGDGADKAISVAKRVLTIAPDLDTGLTATPMSVLNRLGAELGFAGAERATFANQTFKLLSGAVTLENAGALKGALSDKDLQFLKDTIAGRDLTTAVIVDAFAQMLYSRTADQKVAEEFDARIGSMTESELLDMNVVQEKRKLKRRFYLETKRDTPLPTAALELTDDAS